MISSVRNVVNDDVYDEIENGKVFADSDDEPTRHVAFTMQMISVQLTRKCFSNVQRTLSNCEWTADSQ